MTQESSSHDMTQECLNMKGRHDSFMRVRHDSFMRVRHDSFMRVRHDSFMRVRHDSFMEVDMTHSWGLTGLVRESYT